MNTSPLTAKGKECKLCKAKGGPCHLHGGSPKKISPDKSSPKKSIFEKIPPDLANVPNPALEKILLELDPKDLKEFCSMNKRAFRICKLHSFRKKYNQKRFLKDFIIDDTDGEKKETGSVTYSKGDTSITIGYNFNSSKISRVNYAIINSFSKGMELNLFGNDNAVIFHDNFDRNNLEATKKDALGLIEEIKGDTSWLKNAKKNDKVYILTKEATENIWEEIGKHIDLNKTWEEMKKNFNDKKYRTK